MKDNKEERKVTKFRANQLSGMILVNGRKYEVTDGIFIAQNEKEVDDLCTASGYGKSFTLVEETELHEIKQEQAYKEEAKQLEELGIIDSNMINDLIKLPGEAKKTIRQNISDIIAQWKPANFPKVEYPKPDPAMAKEIKDIAEKNYGQLPVGELREMCNIRGIEYPENANKSKLIKLLESKKKNE